MLQEIHLKGPSHSQRAVRLKELDLYAHEANILAAAKSVGEGATLIEVKKAEWRMGAQMMIASYTEPVTEVKPETKFVKADPNTLQSVFGELFTAKDLAVLEQLYRQFHDLNGKELEDIVGKMRPVSEG